MWRERSQFKVTQSTLHLQDYNWAELDDLTEITKENLFDWTPLNSIAYDFDDNVQAAISIEVDPNLNSYDRHVYTYIDLLSDVGGIQGIIVYMFAILIAALNTNKLSNFIVNRLYKVKSLSTLMADDPRHSN